MKPRPASSIPRQPLCADQGKGPLRWSSDRVSGSPPDEVQELARLEPPAVSNDLLFHQRQVGGRASETQAPQFEKSAKQRPELDVLDKLAQNGRPGGPESPGLFRFGPLGRL